MDDFIESLVDPKKIKTVAMHLNGEIKPSFIDRLGIYRDGKLTRQVEFNRGEISGTGVIAGDRATIEAKVQNDTTETMILNGFGVMSYGEPVLLLAAPETHLESGESLDVYITVYVVGDIR